MTDVVNTFTSTGMKLMHHPDAIRRLKTERRGTPLSLQIAPTSRCNLKCVFCSNVNRKNHEDLDPDILKATILKLQVLGAKTVEWTGGGDPTMYQYMNGLMAYCGDTLRLKQGMITNGVALVEKILPENLNRLTWLRISMNCLDYVDSIEIPEIPGILGFSYVMNEKTDRLVLDKLHCYVKEVKPVYVRIVPNCQVSDEEQAKNNQILGEKVKGWGAPYFYQPKIFQRPSKCCWGYFKPFILHDGWVYPCSSVVLNEEAGKSFHAKYRWVKMEDIHMLYDDEIKSFPTGNCNHCVFSVQNKIVNDILNPSDIENFV